MAQRWITCRQSAQPAGSARRQIGGPVVFREDDGDRHPTGRPYSDTITIYWEWNLCPGIGALGLCIGVRDKGTGRTTITVTLDVSPRNVVVSIASEASWGAGEWHDQFPSLPGNRQRVSVNVANPDIVPLDAGTLAIVLPTPTALIVALDGEGATPSATIRLSDGSPPSTVTARDSGSSDATNRPSR